MKTLLVLTDFSGTANNAAAYACEIARQLQFDKILLYHSYDIAIPASEAGIMTVDPEQIRLTSLQQLKDIATSLESNCPPGTLFDFRADMLGLNSINALAQEEHASMIIMGTTGKSKLEEVLFGSNVIAVCRESHFPVILVPADTVAEPVRQIIFACDMIEVEKTIPEKNLQNLLDGFKVPLTVLNVDKEDKHFTAETPTNTRTLHSMLDKYQPQYYNINKSDVAGGIIEFAMSYAATLVLLVAKRHNFMEGIFFSSLTRKLSRKATFPLLVLQEKET